MPEFLYALTLTRRNAPGVCMGLFPSMAEAFAALTFEAGRGRLPALSVHKDTEFYAECHVCDGSVSATVVACKTAGGPKLFRDAY